MHVRWKLVVAWAVAILMAFGYVSAAAPKLAAETETVSRFQAWGYGVGFMFTIGFIELCAGLALLIPRYAAYAAALLGLEMVGATYTHLSTGIGSPFHAIRALVLLAVLAWIRRPAWTRRQGSPD